MQRLVTRDVVPPADNEGRNYRYLHPETGHVTVATTYLDWVERARAHRVANDLPIPDDFEERMEDQLCKQLGPEWCKHTEESGRRAVNLRFPITAIFDAMKVFTSWMRDGFEKVDQAEAERRAEICAGCYFQTGVTACFGCSGLGRVAKLFSNLKTSYDKRLKICGVCRCMNAVQVHFPLDALAAKDSSEKQEKYPEFCWQKNGGRNYIPRDGAMVARQIHNLEAAGSSPAPAT